MPSAKARRSSKFTPPWPDLVIACGRREGILCSAIDSNWTDGDFVTPAICRQEDLTVSVSTGGSSCRRARIVKDRIAEFIKNMPPIQEDLTRP